VPYYLILIIYIKLNSFEPCGGATSAVVTILS